MFDTDDGPTTSIDVPTTPDCKGNTVDNCPTMEYCMFVIVVRPNCWFITDDIPGMSCCILVTNDGPNMFVASSELSSVMVSI